MTEHELEHWARIYAANPHLRRAGIDYGDLIDNPALLFRALPAPLTCDGPRPLLPAQARIATRLARREAIAGAVRARASIRTETDAAECALPARARHRDNAFVEPMSHHAFKVSSAVCRGTRPLR